MHDGIQGLSQKFPEGASSGKVSAGFRLQNETGASRLQLILRQDYAGSTLLHPREKNIDQILEHHCAMEFCLKLDKNGSETGADKKQPNFHVAQEVAGRSGVFLTST